MEWLFLLFLAFLGWILGYLVLKSSLLALLPAVLSAIFLKLPTSVTNIVSVTINSQFGWVILAVSAIIATMAYFLKTGVIKTVLSTLSIPVFTLYSVGLIVTAYLRMIP
jgi:hypothetical protein